MILFLLLLKIAVEPRRCTKQAIKERKFFRIQEISGATGAILWRIRSNVLHRPTKYEILDLLIVSKHFQDPVPYLWDLTSIFNVPADGTWLLLDAKACSRSLHISKGIVLQRSAYVDLQTGYQYIRVTLCTWDSTPNPLTRWGLMEWYIITWWCCDMQTLYYITGPLWGEWPSHQ